MRFRLQVRIFNCYAVLTVYRCVIW